MIALRRLNGKEFILNADLIELIEATPDTIITLNNGRKIVVQSSIDSIVRKVIKYKQLCNQSVTVVQQRDERADEVETIK